MKRREKVFPMVLFSMAAHWFVSCYRAARKIRGYAFFRVGNSCRPQHISSPDPSVTRSCPLKGGAQTLLCDIQGSLLRSPSFFPFFMLVAFEGGNPLRALLLLLSFPLIWLLGNQNELSLRIMVLITFCGLRTRDMDTVVRAVLPKFYLESLNLHSYEVLASAAKRVVLTSLPRVMVEGFLREHLGVSDVVGAELQVVGGYYTGFASRGASMAVKHKAIKDLFGNSKPDVGLVSSCNPHDHLLVSHCKEIYVVNEQQSRSSGAGSLMPRGKYPKPLVFHDGRLAFLPTPLAAVSLFLWLPLGLTLAIVRALIGIVLPYNAAIIAGALTGVHLRVQGLSNMDTTTTIKSTRSARGNKGVLYACNHRTLLDPIMVGTALGKPVTAVTYSLSKMSELIAPVKTVRLTRNRERDADTMRRLLDEGDLIVCPEGTTCREPYLLRFSSLFAELADDIVPVAVDTKVSMFHGTTATGLKWLDPVFFLMNPWAEYRVEFLGRVPPELTCAGGCTGWDVANRIQRQLADALGFGCTTLTRKDKYLMLAGNEGGG
ncbi:glycerol-3-phosphate acyltransferase 1 [Phoenix dactylifera]|uniref:Glycerol-3-phosphate acyltransferase 1 n=1 Tax=Phoenix dactylifera TaxID=42345 RepID=A0A8B7BNH3_PHODC|nr:glycerol-3-phosphate acyltransferase 1 [Phoenix dactylifera]